MRRRERGIAIGTNLVTDARIVKSMSEAVGMVEHFGQRNRLREPLCGSLPLARQLQRVAALRMRANAGIVTAKLVTEVTMANHVVEFDTLAAIGHRVRDVAPKKPCRPPAMVGFQQQLVIAGVLRERHQFTGAVARERGLAPEIGIEPQAPFGLE